MTPKEKEQIVSGLAEQLQKAQSIFFADFTGISVEEVNSLRRECFKAGVKYTVAKNSLIARAMEGASYYEGIKTKLVGATAIALGYDDPVAPARIIKKFFEKANKLSVKGFVFENQVFEAKQFNQIATLPAKPEAIAEILGSLNSPMTNLVYMLDAIEKNNKLRRNEICRSYLFLLIPKLKLKKEEKNVSSK